MTECYVVRISKKEAQAEDLRDAMGELLHDFRGRLPGVVVTEVSAAAPVDVPPAPKKVRKAKSKAKRA